MWHLGDTNFKYPIYVYIRFRVRARGWRRRVNRVCLFFIADPIKAVVFGDNLKKSCINFWPFLSSHR